MKTARRRPREGRGDGLTAAGEETLDWSCEALEEPNRSMARESGEITRLLCAAREGDREAFDALFPHVYDTLRRIAGARMRGERPPGGPVRPGRDPLRDGHRREHLIEAAPALADGSPWRRRRRWSIRSAAWGVRRSTWSSPSTTRVWCSGPRKARRSPGSPCSKRSGSTPRSTWSAGTSWHRPAGRTPRSSWCSRRRPERRSARGAVPRGSTGSEPRPPTSAPPSTG